MRYLDDRVRGKLNLRYLDDRVRDIMRMRDVTIVMGLGFRV